MRLGRGVAVFTLCWSARIEVANAQAACSGVHVPTNGARGDCPSDGSLVHGAGCTVTCGLGYKLSGGQPSCSDGTLSHVCADDPSYRDELNYGCVDWVDFVCAHALTIDAAYTKAGQAALTAACPLSCGACTAGSNSPAACSWNGNFGCWTHADYPIDLCCDGTAGGNADCWFGDVTFDLCGCTEAEDCVGSWGTCTGDVNGCTQEFTVAAPKRGSGYRMGACAAEHGDVRACSPGEGACPVGAACTTVAAPERGTFGDCPADGSLAHGASCALACGAGAPQAGVPRVFIYPLAASRDPQRSLYRISSGNCD
jgi:hypothetical protein